MNENKRIDNSQIKIAKCVGAKAQREKCVGTLQKQTMGIIFSIQNFQLLTWSLLTEEIFQIHGQNRPVANLPAVDFRSQSREMPLSKPLNTLSFVFLSVFGFSSFSRKVWTSLSVSDTDFSVFWQPQSEKFRQTTLDWEWWRLRRSFINLIEWRERLVTSQQLIGDIKQM